MLTLLPFLVTVHIWKDYLRFSRGWLNISFIKKGAFMKKVFVIALTFFAFAGSNSFAQNEGMNMDEQMKIWMEYMTPGPMHEMMAKHVGTWKMVSRI